MPTRRALLGTAALTAFGRPAWAEKAADTLRITWRDAVADFDPYRNQLRTGFVLAHHLWDCLLDRDPETFQLRPLLATAWRQDDDTTWRFTLRPDVLFHDGSLCTAEDVVYTVNTILEGTGLAVPGLYTWLAGAEQVDAATVLVKMQAPFPAALEYMAMVLPILPRAYRERVGPDVFGRVPVGTGPYRMAQEQSAGRIRLDRFDGYFPNGPKTRPAIAHLAIREVADQMAEYADLLADHADWIWELSSDEYAAIAQAPGLAALHGESMRVGYLSMDAAGRSGLSSPLTDLRVRQAICCAIDRAAMAQRLPGVAGRVTDAPCFPTQFGCDAAAATRTLYDPARARALLADAGLADGFETELVSYVLPEDGASVRSYLQAVGIRATLTQLPTAEALARAEAGTTPLFLGTWGSYSINDVAAFLPQFFGGGPLDYAHLPELQSLIEQAGRLGDADERRGLYAQAIRLITGQALWLPLHTYATTYGMVRTLNARPFPDELPRFYLASWK